MRVLLLRIAVVVVPVMLVLGVLHHFGPDLRRARMVSDLPDGYGVLREIPEYAIYGELENDRAVVASEVLERFTAAVKSEFGRNFRLEPPGSRVDVIVFSSHGDLSDYGRARFRTDFDRNGGFYVPSDRVLAVIDRGDFEAMLRALFHEGTHLMLDTWVEGAGHAWSLWLNEGIATWFEDSRIDGRGIRLGGVSPGTLSVLRRGGWIPLPRLLRATPEDFRGESNSLFYSESCLLVDFLMREECRPRFAEYFEKERKPGPVRPGVFREILGDPEALDADLRAWLRTK
ncbi:MAG: hypothetical protein ABFS86_01930 [Planctomycetota bacterium]